MDLALATSSRMFSEAAEAPEVIARQLGENASLYREIGKTLRTLSPQVVLTLGRGSSDHAATYGKYLIETRTGVPTASAALSVTSLYRASPKLERALCIAISQSGRSPDLLAAVEMARASGGHVLALVNDTSSPLAALADHVVPLSAGPEISVAATKSYIAALGALAAIVGEWAGDEALVEGLAAAPEQLGRSWALDWSPLVDMLEGRTNLYTIGRGVGFGIAQEAALKLKETCGLHAEAFSAAEVRHGPMAIVGKDFPLLLFRQQDESAAGIDALSSELKARGAAVALAGGSGMTDLPVLSAHPAIEPILQVQSFYRAANALSFARGLNPDKPPHLAKVTETI